MSLNTLTSITTPVLPDGNFNDESLTSVAFSPNIDLNNFSSGLEDVSLLGVTLPTKISPGLPLPQHKRYQIHLNFLNFLHSH